MKVWSPILLLIVVLFVSYVTSKSDVIDLSESNFQKEVLSSPLPYLVEFFAPWCGHCKRLAPEWEKAATKLKGVVPVGKVDCTVHQGLCGRHGVQGYPTIKIFKDGKPSDYQGQRETPSIVRAGFNALPNKVTQISKVESLENFKQSNPQNPHIVLFSSKPSPNPVLKSLAVRHAKKLEIGLIPESATAHFSDLTAIFGISTFPTFVRLTEDSHEILDVSDAASLTSTLNSLAGEAPEKSAEPPKKMSKKAKSEWVAVTTATLEKVCTGMCLVALHDGSDAAKSTLTDLLAHFQKAKKVSFAEVTGDERAAIAEKFGLKADENVIVMYNVKKSRIAVVPEFSKPITTIEAALDGNVKFDKLA